MTADHDTDTRRVVINLVTNIVSAYSDDREGEGFRVKGSGRRRRTNDAQ
jgi:hypothetical protein